MPTTTTLAPADAGPTPTVTPLPVLHAGWAPPQGLLWWLEDPDAALAVPGRAGLAAEARKQRGRSLAAAHPALAAVLTGRSRSVRMLLPVPHHPASNPASNPVPNPVPGPRQPPGSAPEPALGVVRVALAAPPVATSLAALAAVADGTTPDGVAVGAEVHHLARLVADVRRLVRAGRVLPAVRTTTAQGEGEDLTATWVLVDDDDVTAWRRARAAALPPVFRAGVPRGVRRTHATGRDGEEVVGELLGLLVPAVVRALLPTGEDLHPLLAALRSPVPVALPPARREQLAAQLAGWHDSTRNRDVRLVLRLSEPDLDFDLDGREVRWPLDVLARVDGDVPAPLSAVQGDAEVAAVLRNGLTAALDALPALRDAERDPVEDTRLWVATPTVLDLVDHLVGTGARHLQDRGFDVLLPRPWVQQDTTVQLSAVSGETGELGLSGIVSWNWAVALGETRLTDRELAEIADTKSGLVRLRGQWVRLDEATFAAARRFVRGATTRQSGEHSLADLLGELGTAAPPVPVSDVRATGWLGALFAGAESGGVREVEPPGSLRAQLRPYQRRGLSWLAFMDSLGLGAVLADDMGLGKTIQVLSLLLHERDGTAEDPGPTLLICPTSLLGNWAREASTFAPSLRVVLHHGPDRARTPAGHAGADLVVTSYGVAHRDVDVLAGMSWHRLVLDEAHAVKNSGNHQARAVRRIPSRRRLALTGTPVENRLEELRGVLDVVNPGILGSAESFRTRFATPIEKHRDPVAASRLRALTRPFVLRREKTDRSVISDLPDKVETVVPVTLTREQAGLYQATVDELLNTIAHLSPMERRGAVLGTLVRLKQICNHPAHFLSDGSPLLRRGRHRSGKLAVLDDILEHAIGQDGRVLLFTQFTEFGRLLVPHLHDRFGVEVPFLHGGTPRRQRDTMVQEFQAGSCAPVLLLSLRAGGTGLNLTAANHVVHVDRWWNPAVENQATDRAFRIGQHRNVQVHKLVTAGTVEEKVDRVLRDKADLANLAVGAGEGWVTELGEDALRDLLSLSSGAHDE